MKNNITFMCGKLMKAKDLNKICKEKDYESLLGTIKVSKTVLSDGTTIVINNN